MSERRHIPEQQIDLTKSFMDSVAVLSGSDKGTNLTNSRIHDLPNNRVAFMNDPYRQEAVLYIQPRVLFRAGDYLQLKVGRDRSGLSIRKNTHLLLENILKIEESRKKVNVVDNIPPDDAARDLDPGLIGRAVEIIHLIQKRDLKGRVNRLRMNLLAERNIRDLICYIREYNL